MEILIVTLLISMGQIYAALCGFSTDDRSKTAGIMWFLLLTVSLNSILFTLVAYKVGIL